MPSTDDVKTFVSLYLEQKLANAGLSDPPDDLSLIDSGIIDSFGLLDLVAAVEKKFLLEVDMGDVDLDTFTTFGGFAEAIAASARS